MKDSWKLKELFKFEHEPSKILNDTAGDVEYVDSKQQTYKIPYDSILHISNYNTNYNIPNKNTVRYSDKSICEEADFGENLSIITQWYNKQISEGQIKQGIDFLNYHYKFTNRKQDFISFVKYYFLSKYWLPKDKREKDWLVEEWIKSKEVELERPKYLWAILLVIVLLILGIIFLPEYRELLIGSLLGLILGRADKLITKIVPDKK